MNTIIYILISLISVSLMYFLMGIVQKSNKGVIVKAISHFVAFLLGHSWILFGLIATSNLGIQSVVWGVVLVSIVSGPPAVLGGYLQERFIK